MQQQGLSFAGDRMHRYPEIATGETAALSLIRLCSRGPGKGLQRDDEFDVVVQVAGGLGRESEKSVSAFNDTPLVLVSPLPQRMCASIRTTSIRDPYLVTFCHHTGHW